MKRLQTAVALALFASACRVGPEHAVPDVPIAAQWTEADTSSDAEPAREWWSEFHDPVLAALIARALANNIDVQIAATRIREARATRVAVAGLWAPQVNAGAGFARSSASETTGIPIGKDPASRRSTTPRPTSW